MEQPVWTSQMALGIPALDKAHKEFIEDLARIANVPDEEFADHFFALIAWLERDFAEEEDLMERVGFAAQNSHREQHARALGGLHHAMSCVMRGDIATGRRAIELLYQWFLFHLSTMDLALAVTVELAAMQESLPSTPNFQRNLARLLQNAKP